eukprot:6165582-Amphidinium_carterae.1
MLEPVAIVANLRIHSQVLPSIVLQVVEAKWSQQFCIGFGINQLQHSFDTWMLRVSDSLGCDAQYLTPELLVS